MFLYVMPFLLFYLLPRRCFFTYYPAMLRDIFYKPDYLINLPRDIATEVPYRGEIDEKHLVPRRCL